MTRKRVKSAAPWEKTVGYCRALRVGDRILVTGTAAVGPDGKPHALGDPLGQARRCLEIIETSLAELGAAMSDVVRTRMFVTDISMWEAFGQAHGEVFSDFPPTTTMVEVSRLINPDFLIEIEAEAVVEPDAAPAA